MSTPVYLVDSNGTLLHTEQVGKHTHLVVEDHARVATQFKVANTTSAATTTVVRPRKGGAIIITDLIVVQDKVASGVITVQFTDDTNDEILFKASTSDAQIVMNHAFAGRMRGWRDARIEMISAGTNPTTNVSVTYYHLVGEGVFSFADWDALR